eukprot:m.15768 g.15768  ORF g.15768 m.15768 type:complete len:332 (+) comp10741_c0_seq1:316-1311(+)
MATKSEDHDHAGAHRLISNRINEVTEQLQRVQQAPPEIVHELENQLGDARITIQQQTVLITQLRDVIQKQKDEFDTASLRSKRVTNVNTRPALIASDTESEGTSQQPHEEFIDTLHAEIDALQAELEVERENRKNAEIRLSYLESRKKSDIDMHHAHSDEEVLALQDKIRSLENALDSMATGTDKDILIQNGVLKSENAFLKQMLLEKNNNHVMLNNHDTTMHTPLPSQQFEVHIDRSDAAEKMGISRKHMLAVVSDKGIQLFENVSRKTQKPNYEEVVFWPTFQIKRFGMDSGVVSIEIGSDYRNAGGYYFLLDDPEEKKMFTFLQHITA